VRRQHLFLLDCSASMVESGAFAQAKGLLLQWLRRAYLQRESVALLCFGAGRLHWLLEPTRAPRWNADLIEPLRGGGGTPLAQALESGWQMAARYSRQPSCLWLISDFRSPDVLQLERGPYLPWHRFWWTVKPLRSRASVCLAVPSGWQRSGRIPCDCR
jgi:magnesium chelatase subunit ChlD-like protein